MANARHSLAFSDYSPETQVLARKLEDARRSNHQIEPLTNTVPDLTQDKGYSITSAIRTLRSERYGDSVAGRKIGFTNRSIWQEYNVDCSNWSYMYTSSVIDLSRRDQTDDTTSECDISEFSKLEPKIEPEIVLGLKAPISPAMGDEQILDCVEWIAHGFEIVASVYPGWKFTAADTTAAFALHGKLLLGRKHYLSSSIVPSAEMVKQLKNFTIKLRCNGSVVDEGTGSNVLGSPINALRHLAELLEKDKVNLPLRTSEIVTTGTLTKALSINDGDTWQTEIMGLEVSPLEVKFEMKG